MSRAMPEVAQPKETISGNANRLLSDLHEICVRIERCADRLYGGRPKPVEDAKQGGIEQQPPLELMLERCLHATNACHEELTRLENGL